MSSLSLNSHNMTPQTSIMASEYDEFFANSKDLSCNGNTWNPENVLLSTRESNYSNSGRSRVNKRQSKENTKKISMRKFCLD